MGESTSAPEAVANFAFAIANLGRTSAFAAYQKGGKAKYQRRDAPITQGVVRRHLTSECPIALYMVEGTATRTAVFDFDDHDKSLNWDEMVAAASPLVQELVELGMHPFCVRSGGGAGLHVWLFWEQEQEARLVRAFMRDTLRKCDFADGTGGIRDKQVEVFPKNDRVKEGAYGNAVALPFSRASVPLDGSLQPIPLEGYKPPSLDALFSPPVKAVFDPPPPSSSASRKYPEQNDAKGDLEDALRHIPADDHDQWIKVGLALKHGLGEAGFSVWHKWSSQSQKYADIEDCRARWNSLEPDGSVTLGTVYYLAKENGWNRPIDPVIRGMNDRFAIFTHGQKTMVIVKSPDDDGTQAVTLLGKFPFRDRLAGEMATVPTSDGGTAPVQIAKYWFAHKDAEHIHRLDFDPGRPPGKNGTTWNVWRGFAVEPRPGDWSKLEAHIRDNVADGDPELADWLLNWMALGVQDPATVIGTAPVLMGLPGTGKGVLAHAYGSLWGRHYTAVTHSAHVKGRFNNHLFGKRFIFLDEGMFGGDRTDAGVIKTRLTEPYVVLEQKGIDPITIKNHMIFLVASNEASVIPADLADRRWQVLEVSDAKRDDKSYFAEIARQLDNGGREAFLHDLLARDISAGPNPRQTIKTAGLFEQTIRSGGADLRYMFEILDEGVLPQPEASGNGPGKTTIRAMHEEMCRRDRRGTFIPETSFGKTIRKMCPSVHSVQSGTFLERGPEGVTKRRSTRLEFPELKLARLEFERYAGQAVPWSNARETWQDGPDGDQTWVEGEPPF